jgi:hypothetical protein
MHPQAGRRLHSGDSAPHSQSQPDRLALLESAVASILQTLDVQFKRIAAMQAELDLVAATNRRTVNGRSDA